MKARTMGRLELLSWLNEVTEIEYPKVEMCCDGIGYCQVLDAIQPGVIQLSRLNFNAKFEGDFSRNLKILDETLSKMGLEKITPSVKSIVEKLCRGKFQDNIVFLQWLFTYASKIGLRIGSYPGYQRRLEAIKKQKMKVPTMNSYLIANKEFLKHKNEGESGDEEVPSEFEPEGDEIMTQREHDLENLVNDLEIDLKKKMETNWKLLFTIDEVSKERNFFYNLLLQIEKILNEHKDSEIKGAILEYLSFVPQEFEPLEEGDERD